MVVFHGTRRVAIAPGSETDPDVPGVYVYADTGEPYTGDPLPGLELLMLGFRRWWMKLCLRMVVQQNVSLGLALARLAGYEDPINYRWCVQHTLDSMESIRLRFVTSDSPFSEEELRRMAGLFIPVVEEDQRPYRKNGTSEMLRWVTK